MSLQIEKVWIIEPNFNANEIVIYLHEDFLQCKLQLSYVAITMNNILTDLVVMKHQELYFQGLACLKSLTLLRFDLQCIKILVK